VTARRAVRLGRIRAHPGRRLARARVVARVARAAGHRRAAGARAGLTGVGLRAGVAVVAGRAVGLGRVLARARRRVAGAGHVTGVALAARDGGVLAAVLSAGVDGTGVAVVARAAARELVAAALGAEIERRRHGEDARADVGA